MSENFSKDKNNKNFRIPLNKSLNKFLKKSPKKKFNS